MSSLKTPADAWHYKPSALTVMNKILLTLESATASSNGGFILKLVNSTSIDTAFGGKEQKLTYYMKVNELAKGKNNKPIAPGYEAELDISQFDVVVRDFVPEEGDMKGQIIPLKWLQIKVAA